MAATRFFLAVCLFVLLAPAEAGAGKLLLSLDTCKPQPCPPPSVWAANEDGTGLQRLTDYRQAAGGFPDERAADHGGVWSPDGRVVAFGRWDQRSQDKSGLYVVNSDGTGERRLIKTLEAFSIDWSPDGQSIIFSSRNAGETFNGTTSTMPDPTTAADSDIWIVRGNRVARAPFSTRQWEMDGRFLPDGRILFFRSWSPTDPQPWRPEGWYVGDPVTGREEPVALSDSDEAYLYSVGFSPDGRWSTLGHKGRLYVMTADGKNVRRVNASMGSADMDPRWASDSSRFFFAAQDPPFSNVSRAPRRIYRFVPGLDAPPSRLSLPPGGVSDWTDGRGVVASPSDRRPPGVLLLDEDGEPIGFSGARTATTATTRLPVLRRKTSHFLALDGSGLRRVELALAKIKGRGPRARCRFVRPKRPMTKWRSCRRPVTTRLRTTEDWRKQLRRLRRGTYVIGFRTSDAKGNRTRRIKLSRVRVR